MHTYDSILAPTLLDIVRINSCSGLRLVIDQKVWQKSVLFSWLKAFVWMQPYMHSCRF